MIDFWEALGRMATDPNLQKAFLDTLPGSENSDNIQAGIITSEGYAKVQSFFGSELTQGVLSLMGAGEMLLTFSYPTSQPAFEKISEVVRRSNFPPNTAAPNYFVALGMLFVDENLRKRVGSDPTAFSVLPKLAGEEKTQVLQLAAQPEFQTAAVDFSRDPWSGGCNCRMTFWNGHLHPIPHDNTSWADPSGSVQQNPQSPPLVNGGAHAG